MIRLRNLSAACVIAGTLAFPAAAAAQPIDNGRVVPVETAAAPAPPQTVVQSSDDALPLALAGAALLIALSSAGYSAVRLAPLRAAREET